MKPMFMMMVGLPYSGKSCYAEKLKEEFNAVVHSSDAIREEILGDVQDQNNNGKVFDVLHRRVIEDLSNGRNVIYDATNINYKRRMDTIQRQYRHMRWIPQYYEGWDKIHVIYPDGFKTLDVKELFWGENGLAWLDQDNPHHDLTVGAHCIATYANIHNGSPELYEAAVIDGAGRWKQTLSIPLPELSSTIVVLLILRLGQIMNVGYEKTILMYSPATYETADVIASYVYRVGIEDADYGYSTAINFFNSVVNFLVLFVANAISRKLSETSLW